ncbi:hypothetical protein BDR04DRAFT_1106401 [Suillus decipiens]|nr:hypothetical protein BDR04DRAFT_1106401 [Suillus decipiens]
MLCPEANADTSNDTTGCTKEEKEYTCDLGGYQSCQVHDTIGLEEGRWGLLPDKKAQKRLKKYLKTTQPLHLLVYCMPGRRGCLRKSHGRNYKKFTSAVGPNVRVVVVVTGLEDFEGPLESWWLKNERELQNLGIPKTVGHVCITTLPKAELTIRKKEHLHEKSCKDVKTLIRSNLR